MKKTTQITLSSFISIINGLFGIILLYVAKAVSFCSLKRSNECDYTNLEGWTIAGPGILILLYSIYSFNKTIKEKKVFKIPLIIFSIPILCFISYQLFFLFISF